MTICKNACDDWILDVEHSAYIFILVEGSGLEHTNQRRLKKLSKKMIHDMWSERKPIKVIDQAGMAKTT